jgi:hypothetical protein
VVLSTAAFCALVYWMLCAWTSPQWALVGGALAIIQFGPLSAWMNTYWAGAVPAVAGCLVFGAMPRLRASAHARDAIILGTGLGLHLLTRPFESTFLLMSVLAYLAPDVRRLARPLAVAALAVLPAILLMLDQNKQVTGSWTTLPYVVSRWQYGVPTTFTFQPAHAPHRQLTPQQALEYRLQASWHGEGPETPAKFLARLAYRVRFARFFLLAPLWIAAAMFIPALAERRFLWAGATMLLFALGTNFYPIFLPHYVAGVTCLVILIAVIGLERLSRFSPRAALVLLLLCAAHFVFWYGVHLLENTAASAFLRRSEPWDTINHGNPEARILVNRQLANAPGRQLVFVRYAASHRFPGGVGLQRCGHRRGPCDPRARPR